MSKPELPWWQMVFVFVLTAIGGLDAGLHPMGLYARGLLWVAFMPLAYWMHMRASERWQAEQEGDDGEL